MEVKLLRVITGEEIVAEIVEENAAEVTLKNALVVIPTQQSVGFAPWATVIDRENPEVTVSRTHIVYVANLCLLYTSPSPRDATLSRMPSSA